MDEKVAIPTLKDLPIRFNVKYLGYHPAKGLWGIKHTRKPVDSLVNAAKSLPKDKILPIVKLEIDVDGLSFKEITHQRKTESEMTKFTIDTISYGVQDLIYTRVFSMIVVTGDSLENGAPFVCHSFVCESRNQARQITCALAAAFHDYGEKVKRQNSGQPKRRFAIDLRSPEEQAAVSDDETEA